MGIRRNPVGEPNIWKWSGHVERLENACHSFQQSKPPNARMKANAEKYSQLFSDMEIVARISMFFTKLSILLLFLRIFVPPQSQKTKIFYAIWFVIWFNFFYCVALVLTVLLQCVRKKHGSKGTCIDTFSLLITASTINVLSDIVMLIIPLNSVWKLHMTKKQKYGLSVVFAVGTL